MKLHMNCLVTCSGGGPPSQMTGADWGLEVVGGSGRRARPREPPASWEAQSRGAKLDCPALLGPPGELGHSSLWTRVPKTYLTRFPTRNHFGGRITFTCGLSPSSCFGWLNNVGLLRGLSHRVAP